MTHDWLEGYEIDRSLVNTTGAPMYPVAAWNHDYGGLVAEVEKVDSFDAVLPWQVEAVRFGRGAKATRKECYVTRQADVAVLTTRTRWFDRGTGERIEGYREGAYSRLQVLALVKGGGDNPYLLTFKGVAAGEFSKALTALRRGPIAAGRRATGKLLAEGAFWLTIYAGEAVTVGAQQTTEITPPRMELPVKGDDVMAWLAARYIGPEWLAVVNALAEEASAWASGDAGPVHEDYDNTAALPVPEAAPWIDPTPWSDDAESDADALFDSIPAHDRSAYGKTGGELFWLLAKGKRAENSNDTALMARAAELTGDWAAAIAWVQGLTYR
ncbi:MAG: hypothetical protein WAZ19_12700 [Anaerolineae bacterium]